MGRSFIGVAVLLLALGFGVALVMDVGGLQSKLFNEGPPEKKPPAVAKLPAPADKPEPPPGPVTPAWFVGANGFDGAELERQGARAPMVVYFQKRRCDGCRKFEHDVLASADVKGFLETAVKVRVDPEDGEREKKLAQRFGVVTVPAFVLVPQRGPAHQIPLQRASGLLSPRELIAFCR